MQSEVIAPAATKPLRTVRSFVRREGRLTRGQQRALDTLWSKYGLDIAGVPWNLETVFGRCAPRTLEIGFGNGAALAAAALAHPENDYLGIEVHRPGVGALLLTLAAQRLSNVRVVCADATEVLKQVLPDQSLAAVQIFFPDPWPKKRHHKRRLIQAEFVTLVHGKLKPGGRLHIATDWQDYAEQILRVGAATPGFSNPAGAGQFAPRPADRPLTRFEQRGRRLGHGVWDLVLLRDAS